MSLSDILKKYRESKGLTQLEVAEFIGKSQRAYQYYEEGRNAPKMETLRKLSELLNFNLSEVYEHKVPHQTTLNEPTNGYLEQRRNHKLAPKKKMVPFYDAPASASITETEMTAISAPAGTIDVGDLLQDSEAAIRIYGNSMIPNYPPGCVVGLIRLTSSFIEPGEVYVIETRDRRILKRIFYKNDDPESDTIICYSDNTMTFEGGSRNGKPAYPPYHVSKKEIVNMYQLTGVIKRNSNSVIIQR